MNITGLETNLGITFKNKEYIEEALTHSSCLNETNRTVCNERLEFVGDAILGAVLADILYKKMPDVDEGVLTHTRSIMVKRSTLADIATKLDIGSYLFMGKGEEANGGRSNARNLAGAMEAVIAAIYMDKGWDITYKFIGTTFTNDYIDNNRQEKEIDYKSELQEKVQALFKVTPTYAIISESGPVHDCIFTAVAKAKGEILGEGTGHSKKTAEANAAKMALENIASRFTC